MPPSSRPADAAARFDGWTPPAVLPGGPDVQTILKDAAYYCRPDEVEIHAASFWDIPWVHRGTYGNLYAVGRMLKPRSVLEIGTLYGYGAMAVARGAGGLYRLTVLDAALYFKGDYLPHADANLTDPARPAAVHVSIYPWNTAFGLPSRVTHDFNLAIVDGDHTEEGTLRDLRLAWGVTQSGGHLFLDDIHSMPAVYAAAERFAKETDIASQLELFTRTADRPRGAVLWEKP